MARCLGALGILLVLAGAAGADVLVTACGQVVPKRQLGVLQNDLDCGDIGGFCPTDCTRHGCSVGAACQVDADCGPSTICVSHPAVLLESKARLDMNGFQISAPGRVAVKCGRFNDGRGCGVFSSTGHGEIKDSDSGIFGSFGRLDVSDIEISGCIEGVRAPGRLRATNVSSNNNNRAGFEGYKDIALRNVSANDNLGFGIAGGGRVRGVDVTATGNGQAGVLSNLPFKLVDLVATGNGFAIGGPESGGIVGRKSGKLIDSTVTGNVHGPAHDPLDVFVAAPPVLIDTTCGTSGQYPNPAVTWGVCSID